MTRQSTYNVGIYVRLSQEDMREGESLSIENQKKMLTDYVSQQAGWNLVEICEDDGYSGTNFDRPGVKQLLDDAKSGKINLILCKDLSRFGRNYIEVGQYIDYIFPSFNIRFIALSDNVDTLDRNSTAMDLMPIMNLFNEWHAANTSKRYAVSSLRMPKRESISLHSLLTVISKAMMKSIRPSLMNQPQRWCAVSLNFVQQVSRRHRSQRS